MEESEDKNLEENIEDFDKPEIEGDIDTIHEELEYLEKKIKIPLWIWLFLIVIVSFLAFYLTSNQSPTLIMN